MEIIKIVIELMNLQKEFNCEFDLNYFAPCVSLYDDIIDYGDTEEDQNITQN